MEWEERRYLVKIASLYYNENWTQQEIAKRFNVSRPIISKALQKAKNENIIQVHINDKTLQTVLLENELEEKYKLDEVIVVPNRDGSPELTLSMVAKEAAIYVSKNLSDINSLGISWGKTLAAFVEEYPFGNHSDVHVVPLEGGMGRNKIEYHSNHLAYSLAQKLNSTCSYIYAPAIINSDELYQRLIQTSDIHEVLTEGENVDLAIISMGNPYTESTLNELGYLHEKDLERLKEYNIVGDLGFRFFDNTGNSIDPGLNKEVIGISLDNLKKVKKVVGIVTGIHKASALKAALNGNLIDVLVIDEKIATTVNK